MLDVSVLPHYRDFGMPVWVHDPVRRRHLWANASALRFWGAETMDELCSRRYDDMSPGARARLDASVQAHQRGESTRETWTLYPQGRPTPVVLHGSGIVMGDGAPAVLFVAEPVTVVDSSQLRSAEALMHLPVLVAVLGLSDLKPVMLNPAAELTLGPLDADHRFESLFADEAVPAAMRADVQAGRLHRGEARLCTRFGPRWYALEARPALDPVGGEPVLHFSAVDINELKDTQLQLDEARVRAEAASAAKSSFLAHMSHELRTPLNGVLGMLQVALRSTLTERQRGWLQVAQSSGQLLLTLLNDLLDLSKIESGRLELEQLPFDLATLLDHTLAPLRVEAQHKGLRFEQRMPAAVPALVGDAVRVRQVLFNVVGNAVKFTPEGAVEVALDVEPTPDGALELRFDVTDTGIGMTHDQMQRLFQPFTQADASIARRYGGSGLGLALVRRLVEAMGGQVTIDSRAGRGTRVRWWVRCARG